MMARPLDETRDMTQAWIGRIQLRLRDDGGADLYMVADEGGMVSLGAVSAAELEMFEYDVHLMVADSR